MVRQRCGQLISTTAHVVRLGVICVGHRTASVHVFVSAFHLSSCHLSQLFARGVCAMFSRCRDGVGEFLMHIRCRCPWRCKRVQHFCEVASTARRRPTHYNFTIVDQSTPRLDLEVVMAHVGIHGLVFVMDNDTLRDVPHRSNEGLALQARVSGPWPHKKESVLQVKLALWQGAITNCCGQSVVHSDELNVQGRKNDSKSHRLLLC